MKTIKFWAKKSEYTGPISDKDGKPTKEFTIWLTKQLNKFADDNVEVVIKTVKMQKGLVVNKRDFSIFNQLGWS